MRTTVLMSLSAVFMGILGLAASFLPQEILAYLGSAPNASIRLLIQTAGALYFGFAILNWMARSVMIGWHLCPTRRTGQLISLRSRQLGGLESDRRRNHSIQDPADGMLLVHCLRLRVRARAFHPTAEGLMRRVRLIFRRDRLSFLQGDALLIPVGEVRHVDSDCRPVAELD